MIFFTMLSYDSPRSVDGQTPTIVNPTVGSATTAPNAAMSAASTQPHQHHHIWLVTGPAGCGKTTVAEHLAGALNMPYIEGDSVRHA